MNDKLNLYNIRMFFVSLAVFFACIGLVIIMCILFGATMPNRIDASWDRPATYQCFHDHRL
jgi:hypothetical protein